MLDRDQIIEFENQYESGVYGRQPIVLVRGEGAHVGAECLVDGFVDATSFALVVVLVEAAAVLAALAIIGDEATCAGRLDEFQAAGVTQFLASEFANTPEARRRTKSRNAARTCSSTSSSKDVYS